MASTNAFVTLVSSDSYLPGALAQVAALRDVHPSPPTAPELDFQTVCLVTPESLDVSTIRRLRQTFDLVVGVEILEQDNPAGLKLLGRPDLTTVLTKLHVFRLTQFSKIIFLDADVLPLRPMSHLFSLPSEFAAVPDVGWPDIFNSGVLVLIPGEDKFEELNQLVATKPSWDGGDQGLLNEWRDGNWHRLSFTYNTTPTAAYTYAPAYERYGSQIKAIHFIGPNKPWKSIPYRSSRQGPSQNQSVQTAYDYDSLVDRWFSVYDRHYRVDTPPKTFEVKRYTSAWEQPLTVHRPPTPPLGLDKLKELAIHGLNVAQEVGKPGEGTYISLPLQGRVDLMRPKKPESPENPSSAPPTSKVVGHWPTAMYNLTDESDRLPSESFTAFSTPIARRVVLDPEEPRWKTLPTPGPNEIPNSPRLRMISLPPTPSIFAAPPHTAPDFYASESEAESLLLTRSDEVHPHHHESTSREYHIDHPSQAYENPHGRPHSRQQRHHHQQEHHLSTSQEPPKRPLSPPLISWNPAIEPPPNVTPTPNAFPSDTYFTNVWDHTPSRKNDQSPLDRGSFFRPPNSSTIPETLVKQGHYRNVTGETETGSTPSPDRAKVKSVFPWEGQPRLRPARVFPDSDAPPPSLFLSPSSQSQTSTTTLSTPETKTLHVPSRNMPLSPLFGLPTTLNYANVWDAVPSIQKYASRLVKPPPPPPALAPPFEDDVYRKSRKKTWDEHAEVSSRDGDDEDNADDEEEGEPDMSKASRQWDDDSDGESAKRRSRRGSVVTATLKPKKKEYKNRGVQTMIIETRSMAVQVDVPRVESTRYHHKRGSVSGRKHWVPTTSSSFSAPTMTREISVDTLDTLPIAPALLAPELPQTNKRSPPISPKTPPLRTPREFVVAAPSQPSLNGIVRPLITTFGTNAKIKPTVRTTNSSTSTLVPQRQHVASPVPLSALPMVNGHSAPSSRPPSSARHSPASIGRRASNESSLGSPASSIGPISPADNQGMPLSVRKGTRVWDPARGVDVFKRGSEEVLARFLKMGGAWEEEREAR